MTWVRAHSLYMVQAPMLDGQPSSPAFAFHQFTRVSTSRHESLLYTPLVILYQALAGYIHQKILVSYALHVEARYAIICDLSIISLWAGVFNQFVGKRRAIRTLINFVCKSVISAVLLPSINAGKREAYRNQAGIIRSLGAKAMNVCYLADCYWLYPLLEYKRSSRERAIDIIIGRVPSYRLRRACRGQHAVAMPRITRDYRWSPPICDLAYSFLIRICLLGRKNVSTYS
jgi:hypothetical protein